jgi:hypothetical protein
MKNAHSPFRFKEAIISTNLSLSYDSSFRKSLLRRAIAQFELKCFDDAIVDLRVFFKLESKNPRAIEMMRKMTGSESTSEIIRSTFVGHCLRRALKRVDNRPGGYEANRYNFFVSLLRVTVSLILYRMIKK